MPFRPFIPAATDLRQTMRLAGPVAFVQVGMMAMGVVDTIMVGHVSAADLASVALGNLYFFGAAVFGMGVVLGLDPVMAQAVGARDDLAVSRGLQRGILLSALLAVPASLLLLTAAPVLRLLQQPADVVPVAALYARVCIPGIFPFLAFMVLRQSLQAMHRMAPIVITIIAANLLNVGLDWILVFGHLGLPAMGAGGAAWATTLSRWFMAVLLLAVGWPRLRHHLLPPRPRALELAPLIRMLRLGAPIGVQVQLEYSAFAIIGLLMGWLGVRELASHQVALNLASLTFMVPLGVGAAGAVLVGNAVGRQDAAGARRYVGSALLCGTAAMAVSACIFILIPGPLAEIYSSQPGVIALASILIPIAGIFQVFDGIQVVSAGVLRGAGDTRAPMIINVLGFWIVMMPLSLYLGFRTPLRAVGLWYGLVAGLGA
ncbi:MAG: MATE family efflux transporter, partial [Gemmatimonadales bacterium]